MLILTITISMRSLQSKLTLLAHFRARFSCTNIMVSKTSPIKNKKMLNKKNKFQVVVTCF